jgi:hypothetical protein
VFATEVSYVCLMSDPYDKGQAKMTPNTQRARIFRHRLVIELTRHLLARSP